MAAPWAWPRRSAGARGGWGFPPRTKKPKACGLGLACGNPGLPVCGAWRFPTFARQTAALSSALDGFTSEFGMGSGGSRPLWSPSNSVSKAGPRPKAQQDCRPFLPLPCLFLPRPCGLGLAALAQGNRPLGFRRFCFALGLSPFACSLETCTFCLLLWRCQLCGAGVALGCFAFRFSPCACFSSRLGVIGSSLTGN